MFLSKDDRKTLLVAAIFGISGMLMLAIGSFLFGPFLIIIAMISAGVFGHDIGERSGKVIDFEDIQQGKIFVFKGCIASRCTYYRRVALVMTFDETLLCVNNFPTELAEDTYFVRKGQDVYREENKK